MNKFFIHRSICPGCGSAHVHTLKTSSFTEAPIKQYLADVYTKIGPGIDFEFLRGSEFAVDECNSCG
jgi:hypothetical protein